MLTSINFKTFVPEACAVWRPVPNWVIPLLFKYVCTNDWSKINLLSYSSQLIETYKKSWFWGYAPKGVNKSESFPITIKNITQIVFSEFVLKMGYFS